MGRLFLQRRWRHRPKLAGVSGHPQLVPDARRSTIARTQLSRGGTTSWPGRGRDAFLRLLAESVSRRPGDYRTADCSGSSAGYRCWRAPAVAGPYYEELEIFAPLVLDAYAAQGNVRAGKMRVQIVARLKPRVTLAQARSEVEVLADQFKNTSVLADRSKRFVVEEFGEMFRNPGPTVQNAQRGLWMTMVAAAVVLLIACANVAGLLLA